MSRNDLFDPSFDRLALDHVTNVHLFAQHDQDAGEEVLENILECETDRDRAQSEQCEQVRRSDAGKNDRCGD